MTQVFDDLLPRILLDRCAAMFDNLTWKYGWRSHAKIKFTHWHHEILDADQNNRTNKQDVLLNHNEVYQPVKDIWTYLQEQLYDNKAELLRCYANQHTYGVEGYPHLDSPLPDETTVIVYMNPEWKRVWGGETAFYQGDEIVKSVMPKFGRVVMFQSNLFHAARNVTRICPKGRISLIYKLRHVYVPDARFIEFLTAKGAADLPHSGRNLLVHLCGTYDLLKQAKQREAVCLAGLFHSVYGTNAFRTVLIPPEERDIVQNLIGREAEELAYQFCTIDRPRCFLQGQHDRDMIEIEIANLREQGLTDLVPALEWLNR